MSRRVNREKCFPSKACVSRSRRNVPGTRNAHSCARRQGHASPFVRCADPLLSLRPSVRLHDRLRTLAHYQLPPPPPDIDFMVAIRIYWGRSALCEAVESTFEVFGGSCAVKNFLLCRRVDSASIVLFEGAEKCSRDLVQALAAAAPQ